MRRMNHGGSLEAYPDELPALYRSGIRAVICLLNIPSDLSIFRSAGFEFKCLPIDDGHPPTFEQAREFIEFVDVCRSRTLPVAVYCEAGAGRTGSMLACYLVHTGMTATAAIAHIRSKESSAVETIRQKGFLEEFQVWVRSREEKTKP